MEKIRITFSGDSRDFSAWTREKISIVLMSLSSVIKDYPGMAEDYNFIKALDDSLKLYALAHGDLDIQFEQLRSLLINYNIEGFYFLEDLMQGTKQGSIMRKIQGEEKDDNILKLIEEKDATNRPNLAELLSKADSSNTWIAELKDDLEYVHMGEKTWEWFCCKHENDRNLIPMNFEDDFIRNVYEYFHA